MTRTDEDRWHQAVAQGLIATWDLHPRLETVHYSSQWKLLLGFPNVHDADNTAFWRCRVHPDDLKPMLRALQAHVDGSSSLYEASFRLRSNGSGYRLMRSRGRVVQRDAQGHALRIVGTMVDLTGSPRSPRDGLVAGDRGVTAVDTPATPFHTLLEPGSRAAERTQLLDCVSDLLDLSLR